MDDIESKVDDIIELVKEAIYNHKPDITYLEWLRQIGEALVWFANDIWKEEQDEI